MNLLTRLAAVATVCALSVVPLTAFAETQVVYKDRAEPVFGVTVPDFWTLRVGGPREVAPPETEDLRTVARIFGLEPESQTGVWMGLIAPPRFRSLEDAKNYARGLSGQLAQSTTITGSEDRLVAGYRSTVITGTGRREGRPVSFNVVLMDLRSGRVVVALTVLQQGYDVAVLSDVNAILNSIKAR